MVDFGEGGEGWGVRMDEDEDEDGLIGFVDIGIGGGDEEGEESRGA